VTEVNKALNQEPGLVNKSPSEKGWLYKIELSNTDELDALLTAEEYKKHCETES